MSSTFISLIEQLYCGDYLVHVVRSEAFLRELGYSFSTYVTEGEEPERVDVKFCDLVHELSSCPETRELAYERLYRHQWEALNYLEQGYNVILKSGTGSGKTEAWVMYFLRRAKEGGLRAIALYPTLALANDQIRRIERYARAVGIKVLQLDAPRRDELIKKLGSHGLRREVSTANLVITNPAYLLHEVKKLVLNPSRPYLYHFFRKLDLVVIDELDFYGPRSLALLLAMLRVISMFSEVKPQVVILTATLANPDDIGQYLREVTGRDYRVVEGKPFHVKNFTYVVLGKNLEGIWRKLSDLYSKLATRGDIDGEVLEALKDFEKFRRNPHRVLAYLSALGFEVPTLGIDLCEILQRYVEDDGVTLVFTRSIARAEDIARKLKSSLGDKGELVATHHHLVPKKVREEIEERARKGLVKVIVSPRTLTQGIDIGTVVRVVHVGLPEDVREFYQREGRKGRRRDIPFTETLIIPSSRWDWELLTKGSEVLEKWLKLPLEKTLVNPSNDYVKLFLALAKLLSPWMRVPLSDDEVKLLKDLGVLRGEKEINERLIKYIWERINFYEFGPPYGVKRYLSDGTEVKVLEPIGRCDLVERFQVGCIDVANLAMVTDLKLSKRGRSVTAVLEQPLNCINFYESDVLADAYEEYILVKREWGEEPNFLRDVVKGKITSQVHCVVYPPRMGFGLLRKLPNRVVWIITSEKPKIIQVQNRHVVTYSRRAIYVPSLCVGEYRDYTYGILVEVDEREDPVLLRLGLAYITIILRRVLGIPLETILYGVEKVGEKKFIELHEPEASGVLQLLDWSSIRKLVDSYVPDDLDLVLLSQVDEVAYSDFISLNCSWEVVREAAKRVIDYLELRHRLRAVLRGREITIPRPSRGLKLVTFDLLIHELPEERVRFPRYLVAIAYFDGDEVRTVVETCYGTTFVKPPEVLRLLEVELEEYVYYDGYRLLVPGRDVVARELEVVQLKRLVKLVKEHGVDVYEHLRNAGIEPTSVPTIIEELKVPELELSLEPSIETVHSVLTKLTQERRSELTRNERELVERYLANRVKALYVLYLLADSLLSSKQSG
ncbi:MAG: DEAD/DEAH box helicase [Thermoprotei archaeon]|nr:MAG: DEAD/DEAH box helicase [Thermoprotei archaeon]RLE56748.1 MAG: DEAD/DEAH box helicase [Thermoprotei archaeon]